MLQSRARIDGERAIATNGGGTDIYYCLLIYLILLIISKYQCTKLVSWVRFLFGFIHCFVGVCVSMKTWCIFRSDFSAILCYFCNPVCKSSTIGCIMIIVVKGNVLHYCLQI